MPMLSGAMVLAAITFLGLLSVDLGVGASNSSKNSTSSYAPALQSSGSVEKRLTNGGSATSLSPQHNADVPAPPSATGSQYAAPSAADQAEGRSPATQGAPFADPVPTAPAATQALRRVSSDESARHTGLRIAEAVAAALALASGGLAVAAWRRSG
jgi:hypothetical protein